VATSGTTWNPTVADSLYSNAITQAQQALAAAGANSRFAGVVWVQGENDADAGVTASSYRTVFEQLIGAFRRDLAAPTLAFLIGGMVPEWVTGNANRQAIAAVHAETPTRVRYTAYAPGLIGGAVSGDVIHYSAAGQRAQGRALAAAYLAAVSNTAPPVAPESPTSTTLTSTVAPVITGTSITGQTLVVSNGTWSALPDSYTRQWKRAGANIAGATSATYVLVQADEGQSITCTVTAVKAGYTSGSATSNSVTPTATEPPASTDSGPALTLAHRNAAYSTGKFGTAVTEGVFKTSTATMTAVRTIEAWVKLTVTSGDNCCFFAVSGDFSHFLGVDPVTGGVGTSYAGGVNRGSGANDGNWHHIAVVRHSTAGAQFYIDGTRVFQIAGDTGAINLAAAGTDLIVNGFLPSFSSFNLDGRGSLDELRVSSVARYNGASFAVPTAPFTTDSDTLALYHLNG
jgi:hypothetical protein